jgi:hypothetical protein
LAISWQMQSSSGSPQMLQIAAIVVFSLCFSLRVQMRFESGNTSASCLVCTDVRRSATKCFLSTKLKQFLLKFKKTGFSSILAHG